MDCGVQVDAGKPTIIAEDYLKTLTLKPSKDFPDTPKPL